MTNIYLSENSHRTFKPFIQRDIKGHSPYSGDYEPDSDTFKLKTDNKNRKKKRKIIIAAETFGVIGVLGGVALSIRKSKKISKLFRGWSMAAESKFKNNKTLHKASTKLAAFLDRSAKVITNMNPLKDYSLHLALGKFKPICKVRDAVTRYFSKENKAAVENSLKISRDSYNEFIAAIESACIKSRNDEKNKHLIHNEASLRELEKLLKESRNTPKFLLNYNLERSHSLMMDDMQFLDKEMSMKRLLSTESLQGHVPEDILETRKEVFLKKILKHKNEISCSYSDVAGRARDRLVDTHTTIYEIKDKNSQLALRQVAVDMDSAFKSYLVSFAQKDKRDAVLQVAQEKIAKFKTEVNLLPEGKIKERLLRHHEEYDELFSSHKPGRVQCLRVLAGDAWKDGSGFDVDIKAKADKHAKDLNKSLDCMINMYDKERDITLGSGAGDIAGLFLPVVGFAWALKNDDTTDKRVGTCLELGVPIVGGSAFYLYALKKQFSGFKSILVFTGTSALFQLAGTSIFKKYKAFRKEQEAKAGNANKVAG